jgi:hypothetical protein
VLNIPFSELKAIFSEDRNFNNAFEFPEPGELIAWSRVLDYQEAICIVNPNGSDAAVRGGDVIVSSELWTAGTLFTVVANTAELAANSEGSFYNGSHAVGSQLSVQSSGDATFLQIRNIEPAEVIVLLKKF